MNSKKINFLDIPEEERLEFHWALQKAKKKKFIKLIEEYNVEINSITDEYKLDNFLISAVNDCFGEYRGSENQIAIVQYLIDNGIDVNHKNKAGENALDLAICRHDLSKISLMLIKDVNNVSRRGSSPILVALHEYTLTWREEQKEVNSLRFEIIEELLKRNVDLEGCSSFWVNNRIDEKMLKLFEKYGHTLETLKRLDDEAEKKEANKDTKINIVELHNKTNNKDYNKTAKVIWQKLVPSSGQADTVQGELLRAIEKLRDEACRNGNANFHKDCHGLLIKYLKKYLIDESIFGKEVALEIKKELKEISYKTMPYTDNDIYNNINNRIVDWYLQNPKQVKHIKNDKLYC